MNKKRIILTVLALILVCAMSIMGTVAYLTSKTETVTNTFVAAGGPGPFVDVVDGVQQFKLLEYEVTQSTSGKYTQSTNEVTANSYTVQQGTTIPKQAFVKLSRTASIIMEDGVETGTIAPAPAYLYIEVVDDLEEAYSWSVDPANWTKIDNLTGPNGGEVYLYTGSYADEAHVLTVVSANTADTKIDIITDDQITVADVALSDDTFTLEFYAYLAQASVGSSDDPAEVFAACFLTAANP